MKVGYSYIKDIGNVWIMESDGFITNLFIGEKNLEGLTIKETEVIKKASLQLDEYIKGERKDFDLPINPIGTDFQKSVWKELMKIPYGETRCYKDIAISIGNPNASRAVGSANNKNPISIIIPCHRVLGKNGKMVGYAWGIDIKEKLLLLERKQTT